MGSGRVDWFHLGNAEARVGRKRACPSQVTRAAAPSTGAPAGVAAKTKKAR